MTTKYIKIAISLAEFSSAELHQELYLRGDKTLHDVSKLREINRLRLNHLPYETQLVTYIQEVLGTAI